MSIWVRIRNRQRSRKVDVRRLRLLGETLLREELGLADAGLGVNLVSARAMAALNWRWLRHEGSTDILTFDERGMEAPESGDAGPGPAPASDPDRLLGELFISVDDAVRQAREFRTRPGAELVRYLIHGVLHLRGYDDRDARARRVMKREEDRLVRRLATTRAVRGLLP